MLQAWHLGKGLKLAGNVCQVRVEAITTLLIEVADVEHRPEANHPLFRQRKSLNRTAGQLAVQHDEMVVVLLDQPLLLHFHNPDVVPNLACHFVGINNLHLHGHGCQNKCVTGRLTFPIGG